MLRNGVECAFVDTSDWDKLRVLPNMPDFLNSFCNKPGQKKNMSSASKTLGAPHTIVITSAGLRAAEITRYVSFSENIIQC